ncbi:MAG: peptidyl-prolyl cis-trans isomerase [Candidatus Syntrophosphaera sp.]|nr:peptidyl-prolyl cis-trans isomerase [Candidatus Syntrophosphaera sp.]
MPMIRRRFSALLLALSVAACFAAGPVTVTNQNKINESDILAEFDGGIITRQDLDARISKIPAASQGRYRTVDGQTQVLDVIAMEEAFMAKAIRMGIESLPSVQEKIEAGTRQFLIQEYYKRNISDLVVVTREDKQRYYDENKQAYYIFPYLSLSYLQAEDEASALKAIAELNAGKSFEEVSDLYNVNSYAKGLQGMIKNIRLNGNLPGIGNDAELERIISETGPDPLVVHGPFKTATGWHVFRTLEYVQGRQKEFDEVEPELEQRARPGVETRVLNELTDRLKAKYGVVTDSARLAEIDVTDRASNAEIMDLSLVSSTNPELNITVGTLLDAFAKLSPQEQLFITKGEGAKQLLDQELIRKLLYAEAKDQNYDIIIQDNEEYVQMKRYYILNEVFKQLVVDSIEITDEEVRAYYDAHLSDYTTPAYKTIEVLWFDKEKAAKSALKKYQSYVKKGDDKRIQALIEKQSTKPKLSTLDNIYDNGIITGIGPDDKFSRMVWDNPVGYISPVFTSARGDVLFFRNLRETPPEVKSFTEIEPRIFGTLRNQAQASQQEKVTQDIYAEFNLRKYPEKLRLQLSAEDLFNMADNSARQRNFKDAITFYDQIISGYKNNADDYRAFFMKSFLVAEELKDNERALELFREFLQKFPEGDLNESAQFMIDSLEGNVVLEIEE